MVIRPGESWGEPWTDGPDDLTLDDAALAGEAYRRHLLKTSAQDPDTSDILLSVDHGDVLKTVGLTSNRDSDDQLRFPFDLGLVSIDDADPLPFAAHVVGRRRLWSGEFLVAMNVSWSGRNYLGPKAHPNDGLVDITIGSLDAKQRLIARKRATTGSHLPHPDLRVVRRKLYDHGFGTDTPVIVDGIRLGTCSRLKIEVLPDAFWLVA